MQLNVRHVVKVLLQRKTHINKPLITQFMDNMIYMKQFIDNQQRTYY